MSLISIKEKPGSRRGTVGKDGREYEFTMIVVSDTGVEDENTITNRIGIFRGDAYVNGGVVDLLSRCATVEVRRVEKKVWEVDYRYSMLSRTKPAQDKNPKQDPDKPLTWPVEVQWSGKLIEFYGNYDVNGKAFVNTAGDPLKDVPPTYLPHGIVTFTRYEMYYNPVAAMGYAGRVNSATWFQCPPYTAKMDWPAATLEWIETINEYYWKITYNIEIAPEGWCPSQLSDEQLVNHPLAVVDLGRRSKNRENGNKIELNRDANGVLTGDEDFLDGYGYQLEKPEGQIVQPKFLRFDFFRFADFNSLNLQYAVG